MRKWIHGWLVNELKLSYRLGTLPLRIWFLASNAEDPNPDLTFMCNTPLPYSVNGQIFQRVIDVYRIEKEKHIDDLFGALEEQQIEII